MSKIIRPLSKQQLDYLAIYLHSSYLIYISVFPCDLKNARKKDMLTADKIRKHLSKVKTREELYEYLEEFGFISDPLFGIILELCLSD